MPQLVLDLLKYLFLAVLYIFVVRAVRIVYLELRSPVQGAPVAAQRDADEPRRAKKAPRRAEIVEGSARNGRSFELTGELTLGRADKCHIVLDDPYVSQMHARLYRRGDGVMLEDLGSTNGTYLNRRRLTSPAEVHRGDRIKVGKIVLELRK